MMELNKEYIQQTLNEEKLWKPGEADSFSYGNWELVLKREDKIYEPFRYSVDGKHKNGNHMSRRYSNMEQAFLHILNEFNENVNIENRYGNLEHYFSCS